MTNREEDELLSQTTVAVDSLDDQLTTAEAAAVAVVATASESTANGKSSDLENGTDTNNTTNTTSGGVIVNGSVAENGTNITASTEIITDQCMSENSSGFSDDDSLTGGTNETGDPKTIEQVVDMVRQMGKKGLLKEYAEIRARQPDGTFDHAKMRSNLTKNRYTDVLCYDHSRVVLSYDDDDSTNDYINANFVDGYKQKNAYISTQGMIQLRLKAFFKRSLSHKHTHTTFSAGPLPKTTPDFYQMVWDQQCLVIVMTTKTMERGRVKCHQYWELEVGETAEHGNFKVTTTAIESNENYSVASLEIKNTKTDEIRNVSHWQFSGWPDYGKSFDIICRLREQLNNLNISSCPPLRRPIIRTSYVNIFATG
jgi:tyrosine-protein phosphatase non-receptor type 9